MKRRVTPRVYAQASSVRPANSGQRARSHLFRREPLCRVCLAAERTSPATIRDHIVPLAEGGLDVEENVQPLCKACSDAKTHAESVRGRRRASASGPWRPRDGFRSEPETTPEPRTELVLRTKRWD